MHIDILMEMLQDDEMIELLGIIHKSMVNYFKMYTDNQSFMNF